jgi:hypothetical protein
MLVDHKGVRAKHARGREIHGRRDGKTDEMHSKLRRHLCRGFYHPRDPIRVNAVKRHRLVDHGKLPQSAPPAPNSPNSRPPVD